MISHKPASFLAWSEEGLPVGLMKSVEIGDKPELGMPFLFDQLVLLDQIARTVIPVFLLLSSPTRSGIQGRSLHGRRKKKDSGFFP